MPGLAQKIPTTKEGQLSVQLPGYASPVKLAGSVILSNINSVLRPQLLWWREMRVEGEAKEKGKKHVERKQREKLEARGPVAWLDSNGI